MAAFFTRLRLLTSQEDNGITAVLESRRGELRIPDTTAKPAQDGTIPTKVVKARLPIEKSAIVEEKRRQALAAWITSDSNPFFARNTVNQVWGQLFGTPLVGALDRPITESEGKHPQVLDLLAQDFNASGQDIKRLVRIIVLSRAYQLSAGSGDKSTTASAAEMHVLQVRNLARFPIRPLSVDQLYQTIVQATGHSGEPEAPPNQTPEQEEAAPMPDLPTDLLSDRSLTVQRTLALLNGDYVHKAAQTGAKAALTVNGQRPGPAHVEWLFLTTLSRRPTAEEQTGLTELLKNGKGTRGLEDVLWAILNSVEFATNH
jgi:hypothetical protein